MEVPEVMKIIITTISSRNPTSQRIYEGNKLSITKSLSIPKFVAALFTVAKIWTQPKSLPMDEWIKKMYIYIYMYIYICIHTHTHTLEYYSAMRKKEIRTFVKT